MTSPAPVPFAAHPATGRTAIMMDDGFVYIVPAGATYQAARWESTRAHWDLYWDEVHAAQGWSLLCSGTYQGAPGSGSAACSTCGDVSNSEPGLPCGRVD